MTYQVEQAVNAHRQAASDLRECTSRLKRALDTKIKKASEVTIIVNGRELMTTAEELSYDDVVALAHEPDYASVVFRRGRDIDHGIMSKGKSVKVKEGTIFDVVVTGNA